MTQSNLIVKEEDCKHDFGRDNCPKSVNECRTGCKYLDHQPVARLIEHTAEKESPEIDKEEESQEDIWSDIDTGYVQWPDQQLKISDLIKDFHITRKP